MVFFASNISKSQFSSVDGVLGASKRSVSSPHAEFFLEGNHSIVHFLSSTLRWADDTPFCPLITLLAQLGVLDSGIDTTYEYVVREMQLLPKDTIFTFVGEYIGALNALDFFIRLSPELLERVSDVHLGNYEPLAELSQPILDENAKKLFRME